MKLYYGILAAAFIAGLALAGCMHPIVRVEKTCLVGGKLGEPRCQCRDLETGKFASCR